MKAEHRKELETNILADRMGRMVQTARGGPNKTIIFACVGAFVLLLIVWGWYRGRQLAFSENSDRWATFEDGGRDRLTELTNAPTTPQGVAALYQKNWFLFWEEGMKKLATEPAQAFKVFDYTDQVFQALSGEAPFKTDPVLMPEAMYARASIEETRALKDKSHLDKAATMYKELVDQFPESAYAKTSSERLQIFNDPVKRSELEKFYVDMRAKLRIDDIPLQVPPDMK